MLQVDDIQPNTYWYFHDNLNFVCNQKMARNLIQSPVQGWPRIKNLSDPTAAIALRDSVCSEANAMKLLRVKIKSEFYKFSKNESYEALLLNYFKEFILKYKYNTKIKFYL